jgi:4-diphosphocytidyl-2-C-methyl-D-erythritol kinase
MVPVSLYDTLVVKKADEFSVLTSGVSEHIPSEKNIVFKIWQETEKYLDQKLPKFGVSIEKKIPTGAGLGGGSSNAASFLLFLNRQLKLGLKKQDMIRISAAVGSDVPFFILQSPALVSGTGDKIRCVDISSEGKSLLLVYPEITVNSGLAYRLFDKKKLTKTEAGTINTVRNFEGSSLKDWTTIIYNDFEDVVFSEWPRIEVLKKELEDVAQKAFMSGSGSAVIGVFSSLDERDRAYRFFSRKYRSVEKIELLT